MRKLLLSCLMTWMCIGGIRAQINESFDDGDFTNNPQWVGNTSDWVISNNELRSNNTTANAVFYLSTANALATQTEWTFLIKLNFATSGTNYADVYLTSANSNLTATGNTGYFVRIGNTDDEVSLYRQDAAGTVKIIDGVNGTVASSSNNTLRIRVVRTVSNTWMLYRDMTGTGNSYIAEASVTDATYSTSAFFGILVRQSTSSFFQKHFLDEIIVKPYIPDVTPPAVQSLNAISNTQVEVLFNEPVNTTSAQNTANYTANNGLGNPVTAVQNASNKALVTLSFAQPFANGTEYSLQVKNIDDLFGNLMGTEEKKFSFYKAQMYDIVITELMADQTPVVGLPEVEWLEITNRSKFPIDITGYRLGKGTTQSGGLTAAVLQPNEAMIICGTSAVAAMSSFGKTQGVTSFPSLGNEGDLIILYAADGSVMHAVNYNITWYGNEQKANGGWTLEMKDYDSPCIGEGNWTASTDARGGTPAAKNSVAANIGEKQPPLLVKAIAVSANEIEAYFNETIKSTVAYTAANFSIDNNVIINAVGAFEAPLYRKIKLTTQTAIQEGKIYTMTVNGIADCNGNMNAGGASVKFGLASVVLQNDVIVNELLFNPVPFSYDYLELYNRSSKIIDLSKLYIANRSSSTNAISSIRQITSEGQLLFPNDFIVITENPEDIKQRFHVKSPEKLLQLSSMPSYPDDKGNVILLDNAGVIIDSLSYDQKWHFALLSNREGVSLERIDYDKPTNNAINWTSAAQSSGFGTPTYENSQRKQITTTSGQITISPKVFSPDNDSYDDFMLMNIQTTEPGFVANISIYDAAGRLVKVLEKNVSLAQNANFRWDGLDDKLRKVPAGNYIVKTELFNLSGKTERYKNLVTVALRVN